MIMEGRSITVLLTSWVLSIVTLLVHITTRDNSTYHISVSVLV